MDVVTTVTLFLSGNRTRIFNLEEDKWELFEHLWALIEATDDWMRRLSDGMPDLAHQTTIGITVTVPRRMLPSSTALQQTQQSLQRLTRPPEHGGPESKSACELSETKEGDPEQVVKSRPWPLGSTSERP